MSYESLSHSRWSCTYHVVFVPKCHRKLTTAKAPAPRERHDFFGHASRIARGSTEMEGD